MKKKIIVHPNALLNILSKEVKTFDSELHNLLNDMRDTLSPLAGTGLSAIQIGVALRVVLIRDGENIIEAINPVISSHNYLKTVNEGCFSVPGVGAMVSRSQSVVVKYQSRNGSYSECEFIGVIAQTWQHEIDHLDGVLFFDKLSSTKRKKLLGKYKKLK